MKRIAVFTYCFLLPLFGWLGYSHSATTTSCDMGEAILRIGDNGLSILQDQENQKLTLARSTGSSRTLLVNLRPEHSKLLRKRKHGVKVVKIVFEKQSGVQKPELDVTVTRGNHEALCNSTENRSGYTNSVTTRKFKSKSYQKYHFLGSSRDRKQDFRNVHSDVSERGSGIFGNKCLRTDSPRYIFYSRLHRDPKAPRFVELIQNFSGELKFTSLSEGRTALVYNLQYVTQDADNKCFRIKLPRQANKIESISVFDPSLAFPVRQGSFFREKHLLWDFSTD